MIAFMQVDKRTGLGERGGGMTVQICSCARLLNAQYHAFTGACTMVPCPSFASIPGGCTWLRKYGRAVEGGWGVSAQNSHLSKAVQRMRLCIYAGLHHDDVALPALFVGKRGGGGGLHNSFT